MTLNKATYHKRCAHFDRHDNLFSLKATSFLVRQSDGDELDGQNKNDLNSQTGDPRGVHVDSGAENTFSVRGLRVAPALRQCQLSPPR